MCLIFEKDIFTIILHNDVAVLKKANKKPLVKY